jgi:hypothetical protein
MRVIFVLATMPAQGSESGLAQGLGRTALSGASLGQGSSVANVRLILMVFVLA